MNLVEIALENNKDNPALRSEIKYYLPSFVHCSGAIEKSEFFEKMPLQNKKFEIIAWLYLPRKNTKYENNPIVLSYYE